jgi:hypothetical protein
MRIWPLFLALLLTACGEAAPTSSGGGEAALAQLEDGDVRALEPALRLVAAHPADNEFRDRLRAALRGAPVRRAQVETSVAAVAPDLARDLAMERAIRLAVVGDEAQAVAERVARADDWISPVAGAETGAVVLRIRRLPSGDAFELVLNRPRLPQIDAIRRLECGDAPCVDAALAETALVLMRQ